MESVLLAVALLGFGIGGYFVVGRVARFFAMGTSGRSAGRGARSKEREDMPWLSRQWPTPPGAGEAPGEGREVIPAGGVRAGCQCSLETRRRSSVKEEDRR